MDRVDSLDDMQKQDDDVSDYEWLYAKWLDKIR